MLEWFFQFNSLSAKKNTTSFLRFLLSLSRERRFLILNLHRVFWWFLLLLLRDLSPIRGSVICNSIFLFKSYCNNRTWCHKWTQFLIKRSFFMYFIELSGCGSDRFNIFIPSILNPLSEIIWIMFPVNFFDCIRFDNAKSSLDQLIYSFLKNNLLNVVC